MRELVQINAKDTSGEEGKKLTNRDELYEGAVDVVVREGRGSVSLLQRALGIGYGRAARLIDYMAEDGIVGQYNGSQAREVLVTLDQWSEMQSGGSSAPQPTAAPPSPPARAGRVVSVAPRSAPRVEEDDEDAPFDADDELDPQDLEDEEDVEDDDS